MSCIVIGKNILYKDVKSLEGLNGIQWLLKLHIAWHCSLYWGDQNKCHEVSTELLPVTQLNLTRHRQWMKVSGQHRKAQNTWMIPWLLPHWGKASWRRCFFAFQILTSSVTRLQLELVAEFCKFCCPYCHHLKHLTATTRPGKNARRRIISYGLLSIYAYVMCPGGLLKPQWYCECWAVVLCHLWGWTSRLQWLQCHDVRLYHATDVKELHEWMDQACEEHPQFERVLYSDFWADSLCLTERGCISGYAMIYWYAVCLYADMWITSITSDKKWN